VTRHFSSWLFRGFFAGLIVLSVLPSGFAGDRFLPADLQNDLAYYERLAARKSFSANDRLFFLYRLRNKYAESRLDLSVLEREIRHWEQVRKSRKQPNPRPSKPPSTAASERPAPPPSAPVYAELREVRLLETAEAVRVTLRLSEPVVPEARRLEDPARPAGPVLWIDLPGTRSVLSDEDSEKSWPAGPIVAYRIGPSRENTVRLEVELRGESPFRAGRNILVEVSANQANETPPPEPPVPVAAPSVQTEHSPSSAVPANTVVLMGQVERPGDYPFEDGMTVLDLVNKAGGIQRGAAARETKIFRQIGSSRKSLPVNLARVLKGHAEQDVVLRPGDAVLVPQKRREGLNAFLPWLYLGAFIAALVVAL
jgi:hypothetical protein